jgi:hypothetical protein
MVPIHPQQIRRGYLARLGAYVSVIAVIFTFTTVLFAKAAAHKLLDNRFTTQKFLSSLFTTQLSKKLETALLASLLGLSNKLVTKRSMTNNNDIEANIRGTEILYQQMEQALTRINKANRKTCELAKQLTRSPRALKTIKDLDAAIAMFDHKHSVDYSSSDYATGNSRWRRAPLKHPVPIQDLLLQDIQTRQEKNRLLGEKIGKIVFQNNVLAQQASSIYKTPSEKLEKDLTMIILTKTITTYWFTKHLNNPREENKF